MKNSLMGAELKKIFSSRKILIPIVAVLFIPVLYAGMFLWAFWDPYGKLENLPVAVVNNDLGADFEGEDLHLGNELVEELESSNEFCFQFVDEETAYRELENQNYYMVVEIPPDFSKNATTLLDEEPEKLQLKFVPNESFNFISAQIGGTAMKEIRAEIQKNVTKTYSESIFDKMEEMADGLDEASDGAKELNDGALKILDGSNELKDNLGTLAEKSIEFKQGVSKIDKGSKELVSNLDELTSGLGQLTEGHSQFIQGTKDVQSGTNQLADGIHEIQEGLTTVDTKMDKLISGMEDAKAGVDQFSHKMPELTKQTGKLNAGADEVANGMKALQSQLLAHQAKMEELVTTLQQVLTPEQFEQIAANLPTPEQSEHLVANLESLKKGSAQVATGTKTLNETVEQQVAPNIQELTSGLEQLSTGQKQLKDGIHKLAVGSTELNNGVQQLQAGEQELVSGALTFQQKLAEAFEGSKQLAGGGHSLNDGLSELSSGSVKMSEGAGQLANGSKELSEGTSELTDGTNEMHERLAEAAGEANEVDVRDQNLEMISEPVQVEHKGIHEVPNYGTGFAPYFTSLGLFIGALTLSIVFPFREPATMPKNSLEWFMSKFALLASFGVIQALIVDFALLFGLGLEVESVPLFIITSIVISITFMSFMQMLISILDNPGRFIAIILLILQLTSSAGTYPLELIPHALQNVNHLLPMTYSIAALKAVISSGDYSFMWQNNMILLLFAAVSAIITIIYFTLTFKRTYSKYVQEEAM